MKSETALTHPNPYFRKVKLLATNATQTRYVVSIHDSIKNAHEAKKTWEACDATTLFEIALDSSFRLPVAK
jgi:hypothetical protein